jgi:hypothetical protein
VSRQFAKGIAAEKSGLQKCTNNEHAECDKVYGCSLEVCVAAVGGI